MASAKVSLKLDAVKQAVISSGLAISNADMTCKAVWEYCKKTKMHHTALLASWFTLPMREDALGKGKPVGCQALIASGKKDLVAIGHFSQHMSTWVSTHVEDADKVFAYAKRASGAGRKKGQPASQSATKTSDSGLSPVGRRAFAKLEESKKRAENAVVVSGITTEQAIMLLEEQAKLAHNTTASALLASIRALML
jgi:hypothetical protein